jgi:release factor glutamine methyltransferase
MRTIAAALSAATSRIGASGSSTPRLDAELLMSAVLDGNRTQLYTRLQEPLDADRIAGFDRLVEQRIGGAPIAYLTGTREFMGLAFAVSPAVLVPRPETEHLVEWALAWLRDRTEATVVDVGTGAGGIAVAVARLAPAGSIKRIIATDLSLEALAVACDNVQTLAPGQVELVHGDLLEPLTGPLDLVLANLPYLTPAQIQQSPSIAAEPMVALVGGEDGLELIRRFIADLPRVLAPRGAVAMEVDPSQVEAVEKLLSQALPTAAIAVHDDLASRARLVSASRE